jgi:hypothetical protein
MPTYKADKDVEVGGTTREGKPVSISFSKGSYSTKKDDEVAILDALATDPSNPIGFDPKDKGEK